LKYIWRFTARLPDPLRISGVLLPIIMTFARHGLKMRASSAPILYHTGCLMTSLPVTPAKRLFCCCTVYSRGGVPITSFDQCGKPWVSRGSDVRKVLTHFELSSANFQACPLCLGAMIFAASMSITPPRGSPNQRGIHKVDGLGDFWPKSLHPGGYRSTREVSWILACFLICFQYGS